MVRLFFGSLLVILLHNVSVIAGNPDKKAGNTTNVGEFVISTQVPATSVKDQNMSNTCWSFATVSLLESEILRTQHTQYNLSEMYIVRNTYDNKAGRYVRLHGKMSFTGGGEPNDVTDVLRTYGIMPEEVYSGLKNDSLGHQHYQLDNDLKNYVDEIVKQEEKKNSNPWNSGFDKIMDEYLGKMPQTFTFQNQKYTPQSFAGSLGINPDDFIMITSFSYKPYYTPFILEVPDNWSWGQAYNVPLNDLYRIVNEALDSGYSVTWSADVSEPGFNFSKGVALAPSLMYPGLTAGDQKTAKNLDSEKAESMFSLRKPVEEIEVTESIRQAAFDSYLTTDDHAMHIIGKAADKFGKNYFYIKNSWGTDNKFQGYMFISESYFKFKTILIFLNKKAIPADIRTKLMNNPCAG
jgi:bleomycin hydrolase